MKSPKDQFIIQIEVTNACVHTCSNCTRNCGHHKKPFFMDFETFKRAVDSLEGHVGLIGVMGGEPTLHPEFERFVEYLNSRIPPENRQRLGNFVYPQRDFMKAHMYDEESLYVIHNYTTGPRNIICGAGLWSSMNMTYRKHFELIHDNFIFQAINDHSNIMLHQPTLITRKELGIGDEEFKKLRDNCWVNQFWSGSITPKGAFFCEIAAALDMLLDGPGGWPIEPGWWRREEKDFGDQLEWCELCGIALNTFSRDAREGIDDISPLWAEKLKAIGSPKFNKGLVNVLEIKDYKITEKSLSESAKTHGLKKGGYTETYETRFKREGSVLYPKGFDLFIVAGREMGINEEELNEYTQIFDHIFILQQGGKPNEVLGGYGNDDKITLYEDILFGPAFARTLNSINSENYLFIISGNIGLNVKRVNSLKDCIINPGTLHYIDFSRTQTNDYFCNKKPVTEGFAALLNRNASSLKKIGNDRITNSKAIDAIVSLWDSAKVVAFNPAMEYIPEHVSNQHGEAHRKFTLRKLVKYILPYGLVRLIQRQLYGR